jgi:hypothetical protein
MSYRRLDISLLSLPPYLRGVAIMVQPQMQPLSVGTDCEMVCSLTGSHDLPRSGQVHAWVRHFLIRAEREAMGLAVVVKESWQKYERFAEEKACKDDVHIILRFPRRSESLTRR